MTETYVGAVGASWKFPREKKGDVNSRKTGAFGHFFVNGLRKINP